MHKKAEESSIQYSRRVDVAVCQWQSQDVVIISSLFQDKNVVDYKILDYFSA